MTNILAMLIFFFTDISYPLDKKVIFREKKRDNKVISSLEAPHMCMYLEL